jgi:predicted ferric reductase
MKSQDNARQNGGAFLRMGLYALIILTPLIIVGALRPPTDHGFVYTVGKNFALVGFTILAMQFVLSARLPWIERPFGLNMVFQFHKVMALVATVLILSHPLLLASDGPHWNLIFGPDIHWHIWLGRIALMVLLIHVLFAVSRLVLAINYEKWRFAHDIGAVLLVSLAFFHSWTAGGDLALIPMQLFWSALLLAAIGAFVWHKLLRSLLLRKSPYEVIGVKPEADRVWTITLSPPKGIRRFDFLPGQFQFITFHRAKHLPVEEHHWTISSSPTLPGVLTATIKESGDFTASIDKTKRGDKALVYGPFGRFSHVMHPHERDLVFIGGGIGITPLMSMLRYMRDTAEQRLVLLLYANRHENDIVFFDELSDMERSNPPVIKVVHVLSHPSDQWQGERGNIDLSKIQRFCGDELLHRSFYLCMPSAAMNAIIHSLRSAGVPDKALHFERFNL